MIADIPVCQWSPGSNRSTVDPVVAVARLEMPAPVRKVLIEKMRRHAFDDVVTITWSGIYSDSGANQYLSAITNMNFAQGRLCKTIRRDKWPVDKREGAIVYIVGDHAIGYAAACGNLFELTRVPPKSAPPLAGPQALEAATPETAPPSDGPAFIDTAAPPSTGERAGDPPRAYFMPTPVWGLRPCCFAPVAPPVPEPSTLALFAAGLVTLAWRIKKSTKEKHEAQL